MNGAYGQEPYQQGQPAPAGPTVQIVQPNGGGGGFAHPIMSSFVPQFPQLASKVDYFARRFPWYLWLVAGMAGMWYLQKRGLWKKIAAKL